jgi:hypothetical protein
MVPPIHCMLNKNKNSIVNTIGFQVYSQNLTIIDPNYTLIISINYMNYMMNFDYNHLLIYELQSN